MQTNLKLRVVRLDGREDAWFEQLREHLPGWELRPSGRGETARELVRGADVVIVEAVPSFADGLALVQRLHQAAPRLPILLLAETDDETQAVAALRAGAHDYAVRSQLDPRCLARLIRYALERRNLERALQESEGFFRLIWDHLTDLIAIIDADGRRIYNSPSYRAVLGDPAELVGTDSFEEIHPEDRDRMRRLFQESLASGTGHAAEFRFLRRDGGVRHIQSQATVISDATGNGRRVLVVGQDVTERKRAEAGLREREEFFRLISENVSDLIAVLDRHGRRLYNSPSYAALFGDVAALRGSDSFAEIHPEDQERVRQVFSRTIATGQGQRIEYRFRLADGEVRYMESVGSLIRDARGHPDRVVVVSRDVTERKRSEDAIRESEERYRRLLASTSDYNFSVTVREGRAVATTHSPGCLSVTGYTAEEFATDPELWYRIVSTTDRSRVLEQVEQLLRGETPGPFEHRIVRKDGKLRWIRNTSVPRRNPEGRLVTYDGLITDVTERRRAEGLLDVQHGATEAVAEARTLREALDRILGGVGGALEWQVGFFWAAGPRPELLEPAAVWTVAGGRFQAFESGCRSRGVRLEDGLVGAAWRSRRPVWLARATEVFDPLRRVGAEACGLKSGLAVPVLHEGETVGVLEFHSQQALEPEPDLLETLTAVASQVGQFIQRKRLDEAARESQERLELVILGSNDGVWDWDVRTNEVYLSPRWKGMLGYAADEIPNRFETWERLLHPEDRERAMRTVRDYFEGRSPAYELEHRLRHRDGSYRWILARGVALRDPQGHPVRMAGSHVDLTERKQAEEQLRATNEALARREEELQRRVVELRAANEALREAQLQLIQAAKMEVVGTLAAGVAHEVKNPLQTLLMGLDFLAGSLGADDGARPGVLADMRQAVERADKIVRGLLDFSAVNQPAGSAHDLNDLIQQALHLAAFALHRSQVKVHVELAPHLPEVLVEANKLEQALINLVVNAVHAMPEGGTLTVRSRRGDGLPATVVVEIEDTGTGISPEVMSRVFDPFFTTKPAGVGSGLGLPVTKRIIELHGGQIELENRVEGGLRARIRLPVKDLAGPRPGA